MSANFIIHPIDGMETQCFSSGRKCRSSVKILGKSLYSPRHDLRRDDAKSTSGHTASAVAVSGVRPKELVDVNRRDIGPCGTING
jgi:hypothetical protein